MIINFVIQGCTVSVLCFWCLKGITSSIAIVKLIMYYSFGSMPVSAKQFYCINSSKLAPFTSIQATYFYIFTYPFKAEYIFWKNFVFPRQKSTLLAFIVWLMVLFTMESRPLESAYVIFLKQSKHFVHVF